MPDGAGSTPISLRVPLDVLEQLDQIASAIDRPRSWIFLRALRKYLAEEGAEILDVQEGITQLDRGEAVPLEDAIAELEEIVKRAEAKRSSA
jgi:predicted transcriptional regulator